MVYQKAGNIFRNLCIFYERINNMKKNLWILTEERPKAEVVRTIVELFSKDRNMGMSVSEIKIAPLFDVKHNFAFCYEVRGIKSPIISKILIKTVSGNSSFCDFLLFYQDEEPTEGAEPLYAIEETKTDDSESRNTGVYQRASKFVYIDEYFSNEQKVMLYNLQIKQKETPTATYLFGTRMLLTLGVRIVGKDLDNTKFKPFSSIEEFITAKAKMRNLPKGNVPIAITKASDIKITISGRLIKSGSLSHDPNIGALSLISATLRKLGWKHEIEIIEHGLKQCHVKPHNKFVKIANMLNVSLKGILLPQASNQKKQYWKYDKTGEKLGTIFVHLATEFFTNGVAIFENHAGCEKGYFIKNDGTCVPLPKYTDRDAYKNGDHSKIYFIPDLVLYDKEREEVINIEGITFENRQKGIIELENYDPIENDFVKPSYNPNSIKRTVVLYGGNKCDYILENGIGLALTEEGKVVLGPNPPAIFKEILEKI